MLAASCARQVGGKDATIITVPLADEILLDTDTGRIIPLETSDSSLIYDICALEIIDGKLFVNSRNYIRIYDGIDGHFIGNAGRVGNGVGEYLMIGNISADADTLMVFDSNKHEILRYGPSGEYIGSQWPFDGQTAIQAATTSLRHPMRLYTRRLSNQPRPTAHR